MIRVTTASEMAEAVFARMDGCRIVIKTAAVSDFRPKVFSARKVKKEQGEKRLELTRNPDILREIGKRKKGQILVGFAAETQDLEKNATTKLTEKNLDIIAGNIVGRPDSGFGSDTNTVTLFFRNGGIEPLPPMTKDAVAHLLLDRIAALAT